MLSELLTTVSRSTKIVHLKVEGEIKKEDKVLQENDVARRNSIKKNHSATHLLHYVLKSILGSHVNQAGSLVTPDRLRFDFNHYQAVTKEELREIENEVNWLTDKNYPVQTDVKPIEEAKKAGAMALFGEKYGETVRVVSMGDSMELCGGTHVGSTGEIGLFKIVKEEGIAAGVRRIEAVTANNALALFREYENMIEETASLLRTEKMAIVKGVEKLQEHYKEASDELKKLSMKLASMQADKIEPLFEKDGTQIFVMDSGKGRQDTLTLVDSLKSKIDNGLFVVAGAENGKALAVVASTGEAKKKFHAGNILKNLLEEFGGRGGGKPDMAQGGAPSIDLEKLKELVKNLV